MLTILNKIFGTKNINADESVISNNLRAEGDFWINAAPLYVDHARTNIR